VPSTLLEPARGFAAPASAHDHFDLARLLGQMRTAQICIIEQTRRATQDQGKRTRHSAERLPSEIAKASKEIPSQERGKSCINRAMPADFKHLAVKELEPLAVIYRQLPAAVALRVRSARQPLGV
jgi:hypothetical protein